MHFDQRDREEAERMAWERVTGDADAFNKHYLTSLSDADYVKLIGENIITDAHLRRVVDCIVTRPLLFPNPARFMLDESKDEA